MPYSGYYPPYPPQHPQYHPSPYYPTTGSQHFNQHPPPPPNYNNNYNNQGGWSQQSGYQNPYMKKSYGGSWGKKQ